MGTPIQDAIKNDFYRLKNWIKNHVKDKPVIQKLLIHPSLQFKLLKEEYFDEYFYLPPYRASKNTWKIFCLNGISVKVQMNPMMSVDSYCFVVDDIKKRG